MPEGTLEEITNQVKAKNAEEARREAEEKLAEHTASSNTTGSIATSSSDDEQRLVDQLRAPIAPAPAISEADLLKSEGLPMPPQPLNGPVTLDKWQVKSEAEMGVPSLGGTLNATTEQAEDDKRRELEDDRNRTILSHGSSYTSSAPAYQAPLNAAMDTRPEPEVRDIFQENNAGGMTAHADAIQPPAPVSTGPTLAEIDAQNRASTQADALGAVHEAFTSGPTAPAFPPAPVAQPEDTLPPLPPLPDFSTLPPLPGVDPVSLTSSPVVGDTLGDLLPPASPSPAPAGPSDPREFKIPGQN